LNISHTIKPEKLQIVYIFANGNVKDKFDELVKSPSLDDTVKSSRCEARKSLGMRRTYKYVGMAKDEAQHSPSAMLRAMSMSNGRWTFYKAVKFNLMI
jgi:hypothetical protein